MERFSSEPITGGGGSFSAGAGYGVGSKTGIGEQPNAGVFYDSNGNVIDAVQYIEQATFASGNGESVPTVYDKDGKPVSLEIGANKGTSVEANVGLNTGEAIETATTETNSEVTSNLNFNSTSETSGSETGIGEQPNTGVFYDSNGNVIDAVQYIEQATFASGNGESVPTVYDKDGKTVSLEIGANKGTSVEANVGLNTGEAIETATTETNSEVTSNLNFNSTSETSGSETGIGEQPDASEPIDTGNDEMPIAVDIPWKDENGNPIDQEAAMKELESYYDGTYDSESKGIVPNENTIKNLSEGEVVVNPLDTETSESSDSKTSEIYLINGNDVGIETITGKYNSEDAISLKNAIKTCINYINDDVLNSINDASRSFNNLNIKTLEKLEKNSVTYEMLFSYGSVSGLYPGFYNKIIDRFDEIKGNLVTIINDMDNIDNDPTSSDEKVVKPISGGSGGSYHGSSSSVNNSTVSDVITTPTGDNATLTASSIFGTIVLTEIVALYETIGGTSIQSTVNGNYSVIGIVKENNKYYYKVFDNDTNKVYYMEVTDKVQLQTEYESVLHIKESAMMLNSMEIGSDNFVKLADPNTLYFIQNEAESNGITFYNVVDASDGKSYYIPASDSVENIPLDSIANNQTGEGA